MIRIWATVFAGLVGLAFGSFLNVCLSRWPEGESIVRPGSHCSRCGRMLAWWENLPLASWVALGGRCRSCKAWIGWRHPAVEAAIGGLWALLAWKSFDWPLMVLDSPGELLPGMLAFLGECVLVWLLVALAVFDAEGLWLPDRLTYAGIALGMAQQAAKMALIRTSGATDTYSQYHHGAVEAALLYGLGIAAAAGLILLIRWVYWLARRREGTGLGDAKLMALLAAWLGLPRTLLAFVLGVTLGTVVALACLAWPRGANEETEEHWSRMKLPLGSFLCLGGMASLLWGQRLVGLYLRWAGL